jgi:hypothetical protein
MKNLWLTSVLVFLVSCGGNMPHWQDFAGDSDDGSSPAPEEIVEAILPELLDKEGCDILYPQEVGDVVAVVSCESGESFILYGDGSFVEGDISNIELEDNSDSENNEEENSEEENNDEENTNEETEVSCSADELIVNGSFEEGHGLGNNQWGLFASLPGWYSNTLRRNAAIEVQNGNSIGGISASHGLAKVELDAHDKNGFTKSDVIIVQDLVTEKDQLFTLTFDYSARVANNKKTNKAKVFWNGKKIARLNNNTVGWKSYSIQVKSISEIQRLEFVGVQDTDTLGGYIDNVSIKRICN